MLISSNFSNSIKIQYGVLSSLSIDTTYTYSFPLNMSNTKYSLSLTANVTKTSGAAMAFYITKTSSSFTGRVSNKANTPGIPDTVQILLMGY